MNRIQFSEMLKPLIERHPLHFGPEVHEPIFKIFQDLPLEDGCDVISKLLFQSRYAPVESDFREVIRMLKSKKIFERKSSLEQRTEDSIFSQQERDEMFKFMKDASRGKYNDKECKQYADMIQKLVRERGKKTCSECEDGIVFARRKNETHAAPYVFKCTCDYGLRRQETYPKWDVRSQYNFVNINSPMDAS